MNENGLKISDSSSITEYLGKWLWGSLGLGDASFDIDD